LSNKRRAAGGRLRFVVRSVLGRRRVNVDRFILDAVGLEPGVFVI
jgi:hypothetical protein